jgi:hypothetical protein
MEQNMKYRLLPAAGTLLLSMLGQPVIADYGHNTEALTPDSHAPIRIMGDHMHKQGEWMVSYRFMQMTMDGNIQGRDRISADDIVMQVENPNPGPANVRVVPLEMNSDMHMLGVMYAPNDDITLMLMLNYLEKTMDHQTYMGMMGTTQLGRFRTETSGLGDTKLGLLWRLNQGPMHKLHLNIGLSIPTGSIDEEGEVLTPMNMRPSIRLPYPMQLGSGTYDFEPGITYSGIKAKVGWGLQYKAIIRTGENDEGYSLGDSHKISGWSSYRLSDPVSMSVGLDFHDLGKIDGRDDQILAPVATANPDNFGGQLVNLSVGLNFVGQNGWIKGQRFALEYSSNIFQDANGVQMEMQDMLTLGYQYAF